MLGTLNAASSFELPKRIYLTAPAVSPSMNCFDAKKKRIIIGRDDRVSPANKVLQSAECSPNNDNIPIGMVFLASSVMKMSGKKKSFQAPIKFTIITVPKTGRINGKMMLQRILRSVAPSIRAASSSSLGSVLKKLVNIRTAKGSPVAVYIQTKDSKLFVNPKFFINIYNGTIPSLIGIIIPMRKMNKSAPFHLKEKRAI